MGSREVTEKNVAVVEQGRLEEELSASTARSAAAAEKCAGSLIFELL